MTEPEDAATRGRAIFQRLRAQEPGPQEVATDGRGEVSPTVPETETPTAGPAEEASDSAERLVAASEAGDRSDEVDPRPDEGAHGMDTGAQDSPAQAPTDPVPTPPDSGAAVVTLDRATDDGRPVRNPLPGADQLSDLDQLLEGAPSASSVLDSPTETDSSDQAAPEDGDVPPDAAAAVSESTSPQAPSAPGSAFARELPRVMAVANQKGGVGKTTTAVNLGACLADIGYRVLVVDLDPQGNASTGLGINIRDLHGSMYDVMLHDLPIEDCVEPTSVRNLFCAPSSLDLAGAEIELVPAFSRELRLKRALDEVRDDYDFVLIDCPPSLGLLTVNGLAAATEVVVPIQCEYYALEGLGQLLRNVNLVQRNLNPVLEVSAIILVMYDARTKLADQVVTEVREHFGAKVCRNVVPRTVRLSEAPSFGQPIIAFDSSSRGAIAYRELAKEVSGGTPQRAR